MIALRQVHGEQARPTWNEREGDLSPSLSGAASLAELIAGLTAEAVIQGEQDLLLLCIFLLPAREAWELYASDLYPSPSKQGVVNQQEHNRADNGNKKAVKIQASYPSGSK
jgi:hypothetical protein